MGEATKGLHRLQLRRALLAFLDAVREPSEGMHDAGNEALEKIKDWEYVMQVATESIWVAMCDALKAELVTGEKP
jgi:hypothetical protein